MASNKYAISSILIALLAFSATHYYPDARVSKALFSAWDPFMICIKLLIIFCLFAILFVFLYQNRVIYQNSGNNVHKSNSFRASYTTMQGQPRNVQKSFKTRNSLRQSFHSYSRWCPSKCVFNYSTQRIVGFFVNQMCMML